ncbi:MAG: HPF/RaiA family ribosome-associated protein [Vicinamibacterales bacterium]
MHIDIRGHLKATDAIRGHIERRVQTAVGRFSHRVRTITIWLEDINGPGHGGPDKACQIAVVLDSPRRNPVVVEEVHADLYSAVTRAAERTSLAVRRELDRLRHPRDRSSATAS